MQIHHLASVEDWEQRTTEHYEPAGFAAEGFIHLCTPEQLSGVVERYYQGRDDLILLTVDDSSIGEGLVWEDLTGSGEDFPHVYGRLPLAAVVASVPYEQQA